MTDHVFVGYSQADQEYVDRLEAAGVDAWIDRDIDYGTSWPAVIQEHVETCSALIVVMSPNSAKSDWVRRELIEAQELGTWARHPASPDCSRE